MSSLKMCEDRTRQADSLIHFTAGRRLVAHARPVPQSRRTQRIACPYASRASTSITVLADHLPPRAVTMPRSLSALAMPRADEVPSALIETIVAASPAARLSAVALMASTPASTLQFCRDAFAGLAVAALTGP